MKSKKNRKAVFLDRDGVVIREVDHLSRPSQLRFLPGAAAALRKLNRAGFAVIVVTNQAAIAKGLLTEDKLRRIHDFFLDRLAKKGGRVDAVYYCPHHPEGKIAEYKKKCFCRKPQPGMLLRAVRELGLKSRGSFMIGDTTGDILAGSRVGLTPLPVDTGHKGKDGKYAAQPDITVKNLSEAVRVIRGGLKA